MYAVVGCNNCGTYWILSDPGETAQCPRCRKRHQVKKLKKFIETDQRDAARQARAAILAKKRDESETFADLDSVAEMGRQVEDSGVDDREYLEASGLDADEVAAAGESTSVGAGSGASRSRREVVEDAIREGDRPTEAAVVAYATEYGVPEEAARDLLTKLTRRGEVSESRGRYRLL
ncbi:DUF5817 domain-containing protein [Halobium salinum]|uniref:DUF5817 domain-containing protein n=1 Tax=Halobium salinum TaxID=1364940 RepID=A0ABD5P9Q1_9EURY|nr:DUF5817 domain-containing protein [Halobium salinum]